MLARDEEHLLEKHLPYWREICDSFLLGLDSRNKDSVESVMSLFRLFVCFSLSLPPVIHSIHHLEPETRIAE